MPGCAAAQRADGTHGERAAREHAALIYQEFCAKTEDEEWRTIPSAPEYAISNVGRVMRQKGKIGATVGKILKISISKKGYPTIRLSAVGTRLLHSLVAEAFIGERPPGLCVNHKDGIKTNCTVSNLEYVTVQENNIHAYANGLKKPFAGLKLTAASVIEIRSMIEEGIYTQPEIASKFGVSSPTISNINTRRSWGRIA